VDLVVGDPLVGDDGGPAAAADVLRTLTES